jgi:hypothetical protein
MAGAAQLQDFAGGYRCLSSAKGSGDMQVGRQDNAVEETAVGDPCATADGLGIEVLIGQKAFVGLEDLNRDPELPGLVVIAAQNGAVLETLSLRVGLTF